MEKTEKTTEKNGKKVGVLYYGGGYSPHLGVGFLFLILHPVRPPVLPSSRRQHSLLTHTTCSHTACSHTTCSHTTCSHRTYTHNLLTYNLLTHNLHTQLAHTQLAHTQLAHTELAHTHTIYSHTVAGVALGDIHLRFTWQAWHLVTSTFVSRERRGTWRHSSSFHVAGVVLGDVHLRFTWQAWYSTYSHTTCSHTTYSHATYSRTTCAHTTYSRRRGTWRDGSSLFVAGVARMALGWLWWRARFPRARVVAAAFCVAGVALGDIHLRFTWHAWYLVTSTGHAPLLHVWSG